VVVQHAVFPLLDQGKRCFTKASTFDFDFRSWCVGGIFAGIHTGHTLELPDQKAQGFWVQIAFTRRFLKHVHEVFGEMTVRT
jgi:hypothetical protein